MQYYSVTNWSEDAYRITSPEAVFMDLIVGRDRALLLDTGWGTGPLYETVRSITAKPLVVVNSHGHIDHANGNTQFSQPIHIHPGDMELCRAHTSPEMRRFIYDALMQNRMAPEMPDREVFLKGGSGELVPVKEGEVFELGGKTLEVVELPGHTAGSIGLLYREEGVLLVGDAINASVILSFPESLSLAAYIETLKKAEAIPFERMLQSHNNRVERKDALNAYREVAENVDWEKAEPYIDNGVPKPGVRVMYRPGMSKEDAQEQDFACIVIGEDKL